MEEAGHQMRFPSKNISYCIKYLESMSILFYLTCLGLATARDRETSNTDPCFICHDVEHDAYDMPWEYLCHPHESEESYKLMPKSYTHRSHITCLMSFLSVWPDHQDSLTGTFKCSICKLRCLDKHIVVTLYREIHYLASQHRFEEILQKLHLWLEQASKNEMLIRATKKYFRINLQNLVALMRFGFQNREIAMQFGDIAHGGDPTIFFNSNNILINEDIEEESSRSIDEASPQELSEIFSHYKFEDSLEGDEALSRLLLSAVQTSRISELDEDRCLSGPILEHISWLSIEEFIEFMEKNIIPAEFIHERYMKRFEYLLGVPKRESSTSKNRWFQNVGLASSKTFKEFTVNDIKLIIPLVIFKINSKLNGSGLLMTTNEKKELLIRAITKLEENIGLIQQESLSMDVFSGYLSDSWLKTIYAETESLEGPELYASRCLIKASNSFLKKLFARKPGLAELEKMFRRFFLTLHYFVPLQDHEMEVADILYDEIFQQIQLSMCFARICMVILSRRGYFERRPRRLADLIAYIKIPNLNLAINKSTEYWMTYIIPALTIDTLRKQNYYFLKELIYYSEKDRHYSCLGEQLQLLAEEKPLYERLWIFSAIY